MRRNTWRAGAVTDCCEYAPGQWAIPEEAAQLKASQPTIEDLTRRARRRTVDEIPNAGTPVEFFAFLFCLFVACYLWG
jgi:hypothetical protein